MTRISRRAFHSLCTALPLLAQQAEQRKPLPRRDCFFGIHLDLHPNPSDTALGRDVSDEMVENFLAKVRPDYVQYDCKGHPGWLGYPSQVSKPAPGIVKDSLAIWRRVTLRHGVGLFIHFSGVWDSLAIEEHPEWATITADGKPDPNATSVFGPYVDERLIPQLKEAASRYQLDGAWVDGECWALRPDYSPAVLAAFRQATGRDTLPKTPEDPGWNDFLELIRERFRQYLKHYLDALHAFRPGFQIASNWMYSTLAPERPTLPVDFVSGDYLGNAAISQARLESRYLCAAGMPWDLMAWGFQSARGSKVGPVHKPAVQLEQEAAIVLAQGGGFQIYFQPTRSGYIDQLHIGVMSRVADFCRQRQSICHKSQPVAQVGVLFSSHSLYRTANRLFGGWAGADACARGMVDALLEAHFSVDVIPDWKLEEAPPSCRLLVVPDWTDIDERVVPLLLAYVRQGNSLLVVGAENALRFAPHLGVRLLPPARRQTACIPAPEVFAEVSGLWLDVEPGPARVLAHRFPTADSTRDAHPAATVLAYGKGLLAAVYGPLGWVFAETHAPAVRQVLARLVAPLFTSQVRITAPPTVEIALRRQQESTCLHLINCSGMQVAANYAAIDFVPPVGPIAISLDLAQRPSLVRRHPSGAPLAGVWDGKTWHGRLDRLDVYEILEFCP